MGEQMTIDAVLESAGSDAGGADITVSGLETVAADLGMSAESAEAFARNDLGFADFVKPAKADTAAGDTGDDEKAADDNSGGDGEIDDSKTEGADDDSGDDVFEFVDDVIKGLRGDEIKKLSADAQNAIASFYGEMTAKAAKADAVQAEIDALMADPVVKSRADLMANGHGDISIRGMTDVERQGIAAAIKTDLELDDDEADKFMSLLEAGLDNVARDMAHGYAEQAIAAADVRRKAVEVNRQGNDVLVSLGQFNKALAVKETNLSNFYRFDNGKYVINDNHPEAEAFKSGLGKVMGWLETQGFGYGSVVKMGAKAVYAAAAAALDMPVALNTGERDKKIAANARKNALQPFLKTSSGGTLNVDGGNIVQKRQDAEDKIVHGMDAVRLVSDRDYHEAMLAKYFGQADMLDKIDEAIDVGRVIIEKHNKK